MAGSIEDFQNAIKILREKIDNQTNADFMENTDNWCFVRATDVLPTQTPDGKYVMQTQMQGTGFNQPSAILHLTLNHVVQAVSMGLGNWDASPYVILIPYKDMVAKNGEPDELSVIDSFYIPDPDRGLELPESTYIVRPSYEPGGPLYTIDEHGATYKADYFTEEEIQTILSMVNPHERELYEKLMDGDVSGTEFDLQTMLSADERLKKAYENAKDKRAFIRGLMEEDRMTILTHFLRNSVVQMAMEKNKFTYLKDKTEAGDTVSKIAKQKGLHYLGHTGTVPAILEAFGMETNNILDKLESCGMDVNRIFDAINNTKGTVADGCGEIQGTEIKRALENNVVLDFYKVYEKILENEYEYFNIENISHYDQNLAKAYQKFCRSMSDRYAKWIEKLKQNGIYAILQKKFREQQMAYMPQGREM